MANIEYSRIESLEQLENKSFDVSPVDYNKLIFDRFNQRELLKGISVSDEQKFDFESEFSPELVEQFLKENSRHKWTEWYNDQYLTYYSGPHYFGDWLGVFILEVNAFEDKCCYYASCEIVNIQQYRYNMKRRIEIISELVGEESAKELAKDKKNWFFYAAEYNKSYVGSAQLSYAIADTALNAIKELFLPRSGVNKLEALIGLIGFSMDTPQNYFGASGWSVMLGNPTNIN